MKYIFKEEDHKNLILFLLDFSGPPLIKLDCSLYARLL